MAADHTVIAKVGRVTGRIAPGTLGEVLIPIRGGSEAFNAYAIDADVVIEAMVQIGEATTGLGKGLSDAGRAIERARDKTEQMQARAAAVDELIASGTLTDQLSPGETPLDRELAELSKSAAVDDELARLKGELEAGTSKGELTSGSSND